jgi:uncharacterized protein
VFEWDNSKNRANKAKHNLSFEVAIRAFDDSSALFEFNSTAGGEDRYQITGRIDGGELIIVVVYTIRGNNGQEKYRIISARKASAGERRRYAEAAY